MTKNEARQEAGRCLRCDHFGYGIFKGGRERHYGKSYNRRKTDFRIGKYDHHGSCQTAMGIPISDSLCYLKGINEIAACRVCVVETRRKR